MAEINLLKNELREGNRWSFGRTGLLSFYVMIGILVVEVIIFGSMLVYQKHLEKNMKNLETEASSVDFEISGTDKERQTAVVLQKRLANIDRLLLGHILWSQVFAEIEKFILKSAQLGNLEVDTAEHKFLISGVVPSYTDLGQLMLGLKQSPNVLDVNLKSSTLAKGEKSGYNFNIEVSFNPKLLTK